MFKTSKSFKEMSTCSCNKSSCYSKPVRPKGLRNRYEEHSSFIHQQAAVVHKSSFSKTTLLLLCKGSICASTYSSSKAVFYLLLPVSKHLKVSINYCSSFLLLELLFTFRSSSNTFIGHLPMSTGLSTFSSV